MIFGWCGALGLDLHRTECTLRELLWMLKGRAQYETNLNAGMLRMLGHSLSGEKQKLETSAINPYEEL